MNETLASAIHAAEAALDGRFAYDKEYFTDLAHRLGRIEVSDVPDLAYMAILLDRIGFRDESLQVLRLGRSELAGSGNQAIAELLNVEGMLAGARGEHGNALAAFSEALPLAGDDTDLAAKITVNRAVISLRVGAIGDARASIAAMRELKKPSVPSVDMAAAKAEVEIARTARNLKVMRNAVMSLREAASRRIAELGPDNPEAVVITADLAAGELDLARMEGSRDRIQRVADVLEALCCRLAAEQGAKHPVTLTARANLDSAWVDLAILEGTHWRLVQATESLAATAQTIEVALGAEHPQSLAVAANLATSQLKLAQAEQSIEKFIDSMKTLWTTVRRMESALGSSHPMTARVRADATVGLQNLLRLQTPALGPFMPTQVDEAAARTEINRAAYSLPQDRADETAAPVLDNMIDAWADQWVRDVTAEQAKYAAMLTSRADAVNAPRAAYDAELAAANETLTREIGTRRALADRLKHAARRQLVQRHVSDVSTSPAHAANAEQLLIELVHKLEDFTDEVTPERAHMEFDETTLQLFWMRWPALSAWAGSLWRLLSEEVSGPGQTDIAAAADHEDAPDARRRQG